MNRRGCALAMLAFAIFAGVVAVIAAAAAQAAPPRGASVEEIVGALRLTDPEPRYARAIRDAWAVSPDGERVAFVVAHGDLATDTVVYRLLEYRRDALARFLATPAAEAPVPRERFRLATGARPRLGHAVRALRWASADVLTFIAEPDGEAAQLYALSGDAEPARVLTAASGGVVSAAYDPRRDRTVYLAQRPTARFERTLPAYVVGAASLAQLLRPTAPTLVHLRLQLEVRTGLAPAREIGAPFDVRLPPEIALAPDGRHALLRLPVAEPARRERWLADYPVLASQPWVAASYRAPPAYASPEVFDVAAFEWLDVERGTLERRWDAPDGMYVGGAAVDATWLPDGSGVVLGNTFLPLADAPAAERARRGSTPAVAEYRPRTRSWHVLAWLDAARGCRYVGLDALPAARIRVHCAGQEPVTYERDHDAWRARPVGEAADDVELYVAQSETQPPQLAVRSARAPAGRALMDFLPWLGPERRARVEPLTWSTAGGRTVTGALLGPPGPARDGALPLLVQLGGYVPGEFVLDAAHGYTSALAAQAVAARGIRVLLVPEQGAHTASDLAAYQATVEAAVATLVAAGRVDPARVAIAGFSAQGNVVRRLITFSGTRFRAAVIADAWNLGLFGYYAYVFGKESWGMPMVESIHGGYPWGADAARWLASDPTFHTDRVTAAVRLEQYSIGVPPHFDLYAGLRRLGRPAELVVYPDGGHQLFRPRQRLTSLGGTVDWLAFWLLDREDPTPDKAEQYARWRALRAGSSGAE